MQFPYLFDGVNLPSFMDFDMMGAFIKTKTGNQFLWPNTWIDKDGENLYRTLSKEEVSTLKLNKMSETKTLGEARVRTDFNVSGSSLVDEIKQKSAELINLVSTIQDGSEAPKEAGRLKALAMTSYEEAAMWAVKAATA